MPLLFPGLSQIWSLTLRFINHLKSEAECKKFILFGDVPVASKAEALLEP